MLATAVPDRDPPLSMQDPTPALSVIVPTHGRPAIVAGLLEALDRQTLAPSRFEVILVDDGSPVPLDLSGRESAYALQLLRQEQAGPGAARNLALEHCRAPLTLILNDDARPAPDLLEQHLAAHRRAPERCAVLGSFPFTREARRSAFTRLLAESDLLFCTQGLRPGELHDWRFFWTCNISLPTEALRACGGFDATLFDQAIVEDVELGYRLELEGWRVFYAPECIAEHEHRFTPQAFLQRAEKLGFYLTRMQAKHGLPAILRCRDEAGVQALKEQALDRVERCRPAFQKLRQALERLDEEYSDRALPASTAANARDLIHRVGEGLFAAGVHRAVTGVDPLTTLESRAGERVSIVIVSHDALENTRRCIEALRAARSERHPTELIVVDNGSTDGSAEWLAAQEDLILLRNESNIGAPRARNQGTVRASGDWIAYLDNDVFVPPGWLERALYHGNVDPRVGAIALVANRASKLQQVEYEGGDDAAAIEAFAEELHGRNARCGIDADLFTSLAVLLRREVVDRVGGFDPTFSPWGFEDDDLALRVRLAGWKNRVALDTFVYHAPYPDAAKHERHSAHLAANWERFVRKWGRPGPIPPLFDYGELDLSREGLETQVPLHCPLEDEAHQAAVSGVRSERQHSSDDSGPRSVVILGSGRSGTSMLAGSLARAGWNVGAQPYPGRESNPKGFFETEEINGINEALIAAAFPAAKPNGRMQRWLAAPPGPVPCEAPEHLAQRMRRLAGERPFAYKDPRFCVTLPAWREHLGDFGVICIFREPAVTAESILREVASQEYLRGVELDFDGALELWRSMYERALEQSDRGDWLFLHYEQLFTDEGIERLEAFVDGRIERGFPDRALQRTRSERPVPPEIADLYGQLCSRAGLAAPAIATDAPLFSIPVEPPDLSVLICTYQRRDTLERCLRSFQRQSATGRYELVIVNDGSTDGTRELLEEFDFQVPVQIIHRENGGLSAARNSGLEVARGRYVLLVNDDTIADEKLVATHLAAHAAQPDEVAVLGSFEQPAHVLDNALMRVLEDDTFVFCFSQLEPGKRHDWNAFWTCNISVLTDAVRATDCFDETFRHYGCEDTDLGLRLHEGGIEVLYEPQARAWHDHVLDFDELARRNRTTAQAWVRLFRKHPIALQHPYWRGRADLTLEGMERGLVQALPERPLLEASLRSLAGLDLGALERTGPEGRELARACEATLRSQLRVMNSLWWSEGQVAGLREWGVGSFRELIEGAASPASESRGTGGIPCAPGPDPSREASRDVAEPWPLATEAQHRFLAWPRYGDEGDLERLLATWAECLGSLESTCLCLRHDPRLDGDLEEALERLQAAWDAAVEPTVELEVLLVDGEMEAADLERLGLAVEALLEIEGCEDPAREAFARLVGCERLTSPQAV